MKRKLLILLTLSILSLCIVLGVMIWQLNTIVASYKPHIEQYASQAAGTPVQIGGLELALFPSIAVHLKGVQVGQDSADHKGPAPAKFDDVLLRVALGSLLQGKLQVQELLIQEPSLNIVQRGGKLLLPGLASKKADASSSRAKDTSAKPQESADSPKANDPSITADKPSDKQGSLAFELSAFSIREGNFVLDNQDSKQRIALEKVNLHFGLRTLGTQLVLQQISFDARGPGNAPLKLKIPELRLQMDSQELSTPALAFELPGVTGASGFEFAPANKRASFTLQELRLQLPALSAFLQSLDAKMAEKLTPLNLAGEVQASAQLDTKGSSYEGQANVSLTHMGLSLAGMTLSHVQAPLLLHVTNARTTLDAQTLSFALNQQEAACALASVLEGQSIALLQKFDCSIFGGKSKLSSSYALTNKQLETSLDLEGIDLTRMLSALAPAQAQKLRGTLAKFQLNFRSTLGAQLLPGMQGSGRVSVQDGALLGVNVAAETLRSISKLPFLADSLFNTLPKDVQQELAGDVTDIKRLESSFSIGSGRILTDDFILESKLFSLSAKGWFSFTQEVDLNATIAFSPALSKSIVAAVKEFSSLQDAESRIRMPLAIKGQLPKIIVIPDPVALLNRIGRGKIEKEAGRLLDKVLGGKGKAEGQAKGSEIIKGIGDLFRR